jgi:hypothetical protein
MVHHIIMATEQIQDMFVYTSIEVLIGFQWEEHKRQGWSRSEWVVSILVIRWNCGDGANNDENGQDSDLRIYEYRYFD